MKQTLQALVLVCQSRGNAGHAKTYADLLARIP